MSLDCKVKMSIGHRRRCRFWILFYLLSSQAFAHIGSVNFNKKVAELFRPWHDSLASPFAGKTTLKLVRGKNG